MKMPRHQCDPSTHPLGGLLTLSRTLHAIVDVLNRRTPTVIAAVDDCEQCRLLLTVTLAGFAATFALSASADARMAAEMQLSAVQAALDNGEVETPPDGFS